MLTGRARPRALALMVQPPSTAGPCEPPLSRGTLPSRAAIPGPRAAWVLERCLTSGAWRAADLWAAARCQGVRGTLLRLIERQAADWRRAGASDAAGRGEGGCRMRGHVSLMATLAAASGRIASELLRGEGEAEAEAARMLEALAALHEGAPFHEETRDGVVRLLAALGGGGALAALLRGPGAGAARARALVLRVLHGTLKRCACASPPLRAVHQPWASGSVCGCRRHRLCQRGLYAARGLTR
jgi:hypothetical protein